FTPLGIEVGHACYAPVFPHVDPRHHAIGADLGSVADGIGNVADERALLGSNFTALDAKTTIDAMRTISMRAGVDGNRTARADPNAQGATSFNEDVANPSHRMRSVRIAMRIAPGEVGGTGNRNFFLQQRIIRLEVLIGDGPVGSNAILGVDAKIGWVETRRKACPMDGATTDPFPTIIRAQRNRVLAAGNAQLVPVELG